MLIYRGSITLIVHIARTADGSIQLYAGKNLGITGS